LSIALAATWNPRGELPRLARLLSVLTQAYRDIILAVHPTIEPDTWQGLLALQAGLGFQTEQAGMNAAGCRLVPLVAPDWSQGRHFALEKSLESEAGYIQYADLDRLLRWVETQQEEWLAVLAEIQQHDCLIIGRTEKAYGTHPQALVQTEALSNLVVSHLLGMPCDVSAGSKGFSRRAVEFLVVNSATNSRPGRALGTDAEWPILLQRGGFTIESIFVDGLDWESADRYKSQAAGLEDQRRAAAAYDTQLVNWKHRLRVAHEIIQSGLEASGRPLAPVDLAAQM
jgi:hypothetical protein